MLLNTNQLLAYWQDFFSIAVAYFLSQECTRIQYFALERETPPALSPVLSCAMLVLLCFFWAGYVSAVMENFAFADRIAIILALESFNCMSQHECKTLPVSI